MASLALLLSAVFTYFMVTQLTGTVVARYARDLGLGVQTTGVAWATPSLSALAARPLAGHLADKVSEPLVMALGFVFACGASLLYSIPAPEPLVAGRVLHGLAHAFFISTSIAATAAAAGTRAARALGLRSALIAFASLVAPPLAGLAADCLGYRAVFLSSAFLAAVFAPLLFKAHTPRLKTAREGREAGWREALTPLILLLAVVSGVNGAALMGITGLLQAHYRDEGYPAALYGFFMAVYGASSLAARILGGWLSERVNPLLVASTGHALSAASLYLLSTHYRPPESLVAALLYGAGMGLTVPSQQYAATLSAPPRARNKAMAVYAMGYDAGAFAGTAVLSCVAASSGYQSSYLLASLGPAAAATALALASTRWRPSRSYEMTPL